MSLLEIKNLEIQYKTGKTIVRAVNNISMKLENGETLGLVGETGAGKTTTALGIMRLVPDPPGKITSGEILFQGENLLKKSKAEMRKIRGNKMSMIFQDPMTALNPVMTVGEQIAEVIKHHENVSMSEALKKSDEMLELVGISAMRRGDYPHQFSGGMKQRVIIAIALACNPQLLIADEPTTALDVTIQAQVLRMIKDLKEKLNTSMLLITHDLGIVADVCDNVAVMYAGEIVEYGSLKQIFKVMSHPYIIGLFGSIPKLDEEVSRLTPIKGLMPDPTNLPTGCHFADRCPFCDEKCIKEHPSLKNLGDEHVVRCFHDRYKKES